MKKCSYLNEGKKLIYFLGGGGGGLGGSPG